MRQKQLNYLTRHPDRRKASIKKYHDTHKEQERQTNKLRAKKYRASGQARKWGQRYRASDKGQYAQRKHKLKQFGITPEQYDVLLEYQGGVCGICKLPPKVKRLSVDHDWATGKIRGLLCYKCNYKLGRDSTIIGWLINALDYMDLDERKRKEAIIGPYTPRPSIYGKK